MLRKLMRTLLSVPLVTVPMAAWGLGLGEIQLNSALNQPLNAEIELLSVDPGAADSIRVALASYETFAKFGLDRPSGLMFLRFGVEQGAGGGYRITVTSDRPVREPFLDFLIELEWRQGRLLREYTLLLDPPDMVAKAPPRLAAPTVAPAKAPVPPRTSTGTTRMAGTAAGQGLSYGPVKPDDTLWSISKRLRPEGYTIKQTMIALFQANQDAFLDNNINQLRKGAVLRLDDPSIVATISAADAEREVARQSRRWEELKRELGEQGMGRPATESMAAPDGGVAAATGPKLTLVAPAGSRTDTAGGQQGGGSGATNADAIRADLLRALEDAEARAQENEYLRQRVTELEVQIASMQRLLSLKSDDLAQLQAQLGKGETAAAPETATSEKPQPAPKPKPAVPPKPKPAPAKAPPPPPEPSLIDTLLANMTALGIGAVALMVAGLGLVWARRRKSGGFQESILSGGTSSMLSPKDDESGSSMETSFLSDLASDGIGTPVHDAEVDPLTEADVYLAYGRHQQAEELLRDAIQENPERHELLGKLMEVYYKTKNKPAFMAQVEAAHSALDGHGAVWDKIAAMGHELAPEHPLFAEAPAAPMDDSDDADAVTINDVLDIGLDLDALAAEMEPGDDLDLDLDLDLGVDLSDFDEPAATGSRNAPGAEEAEQGTDLDTAAVPVIEAEEEDPLADLNFGTAEPEPAASDALEFDLDGFDLPEPADKPIDEPAAPADFGNAIAFEGMDEALSAAAAAEPRAAIADETAYDPMALEFGADLAEMAGAGTVPAADAAVPEVGTEADPATADEGLIEFSGLDGLDAFGLPAEDTAAPVEVPESMADPVADEGLIEFSGLADLDAVPPAEEVEASIEATGFDITIDEAVESTPVTALAGFDETDADGSPAFGDLAGLDSDDLLKDFDLGGLDDGEFGSLDEVGTKLDLATAYVEMGDADGARDMLEEILQEGDDEQKQKARELLDQIAAQA